MTRPNFYQKSFGVATHLWHFRWGQTRNRKTLRVLVLCKIDISSYLSFVGWPSLRIWKDEGARSRRKFWRNFWWDFRSGLDIINSSRLEKFMKWTHKSEMVVNGDGMFLHIMTNNISRKPTCQLVGVCSAKTWGGPSPQTRHWHGCVG